MNVDLISGSKLISKANISATGVTYSRLDIEEEERYLDLGIYYRARLSEAALCANEHEFVVGGGNSGGSSVSYRAHFL